MITFEEQEELQKIIRTAKITQQIRRADLRKATAAKRAIERGIQRNCYLMKSYEAKVQRVEPGGAEFEECVSMIERLQRENDGVAVLKLHLHQLIAESDPFNMTYNPIEVID